MGKLLKQARRKAKAKDRARNGHGPQEGILIAVPGT